MEINYHIECLSCGAQADAMAMQYAEALRTAHQIVNPDHQVAIEFKEVD